MPAVMRVLYAVGLRLSAEPASPTLISRGFVTSEKLIATPLALRPCRRACARHKEKEAYAEQDVDFCLSARPGGSPSLIMLAAGGAGGGGAGLLNGENATAGTAAANASTPAAKMNPAGAKPSSPSAGDPAATQPANNK
jgi:hypothetical protein